MAFSPRAHHRPRQRRLRCRCSRSPSRLICCSRLRRASRWARLPAARQSRTPTIRPGIDALVHPSPPYRRPTGPKPIGTPEALGQADGDIAPSRPAASGCVSASGSAATRCRWRPAACKAAIGAEVMDPPWVPGYWKIAPEIAPGSRSTNGSPTITSQPRAPASRSPRSSADGSRHRRRSLLPSGLRRPLAPNHRPCRRRRPVSGLVASEPGQVAHHRSVVQQRPSRP